MPAIAPFIVVRVDDVDTSLRLAHAMDTQEQYVQVHFRDYPGGMLLIPSIGEFWLAERRGNMWYFDKKLDNREEHESMVESMGQGDMRLQAPGTMTAQTQALYLNQRALGTTIEDVFATPFSIFPVTGILDNFNRADEGPPMTDWEEWNAPGIKIVSNQAVQNAAFTYSNAAWGQVYGQDVEAFAEISGIAVPGTGVDMGIYARQSLVSGSLTCGYSMFFWHGPTEDSLGLWREDPGNNWTRLSPDYGILHGRVKAIGIRCIGSQIEGWYRDANGWILHSRVIDATYSGIAPNNRIAIELPAGAGAAFDNFGAGEVSKAFQEVKLTHNAVSVESITPSLNGLVLPKTLWTYIPETRALKFDPPVGEVGSLSVSYQTWQRNNDDEGIIRGRGEVMGIEEFEDV